MIVDGKEIAADMKEDAKRRVDLLGRAPVLVALTSEPTRATQQFLSLKQKFAAEVGIEMNVVSIESEATTEDFIKSIKEAITESDGVVIQLPLPKNFDLEEILAVVPPSHDVDGIGREPVVLPPVVRAIKEIVEKYEIPILDRKAVVVGEGRLVGKPAAAWLTEEGAAVTVVTREQGGYGVYAEADIIVLGAGEPNLLDPDMVKDGVVVFDAGTSEDAGKLKGDADPRVAEKASIFTPVPGGIGPITVAALFHNLLDLIEPS